jgi:outer membrane protein assembly factor BamB/DNA-binding beta-propeller fold protein YncE
MMGGPRRLLAVALAATVLACEAPPPPAASPSAAAGSGVLTDVLTYKVDNERTGIMPGPALVDQPEILWEVDLGAGSAASPLVHDGEVIVAARDGRIRALSGDSGHESWSLQLDAGIAWTPTIGAGILYVVTEDGVLRAIRLDDRSIAWSAEGFLDETIVTAVGDLVLAGAPGELVALSVEDGEERWRQKTGGSDRVATHGSVAYVGGEGSGTLTALAVDDGVEQWHLDLDSARVLTPTIVEDGLVAATRDNAGGHNVVLGLAADGTQRWRWEPLRRGRIAAFTVDTDRVLVKSDVTDTAFQAIDIRTGDELWTTPLPGQLQMIPVVADETVYVGGREAGITALDTTSGAIRWALPFEGLEGGGMVVTGGLLIAAIQERGGGGRVVALADPADPRHAALASERPTSQPSAVSVPSLPIEILSVDVIPGRSLPLGAAVAPDGTMYTADMWNSRVVIRHPDGEIEYWGDRGGGPGEFDFAPVTENDSSTSIAVSPDGELIVVGDGNNHRVQVFDGSRRHVRSVGRLGRDDRQFVNPCCLTVDAEHRIWVVDTAQAEVQVFDEDGTHLRTFGSLGSGDGELSRPGIPFVNLAKDEVYIPDFANRRISVFSTDGTWLRHYDRKLNDELRFDEVNLVVVDRAGRLFVVDTTNRLFVLDRDGTLLGTYAATASGVGEIELGLFVLDEDGRMYLADLSGTTEARLIIGQLGAPLWPPPTE